MNDSSLRQIFSRDLLSKTSLKLAIVTICIGSLSACGNLINKQSGSPQLTDPSKPTVAIPDDPEDDNSTNSSPTPAPTPIPSKPTKPVKPCQISNGRYYVQNDDGMWDSLDVPQFHSVEEEDEFWSDKSGSCHPTKPGQSPTPAPSATPIPPPVSSVKPSFYCKPDGSGNFDTSTTIMTGGNGSDPSNGSYVFGQGGGCVNRPLREVWAVAMNNSLLAWDGTSNSSNVIAPPANVTKAFDVHYSATRKYLGVPFTVTWDMNWFHILQKGTTQAPEKILINYHRYNGTTHIPYWEGSILIQKVTDQITGVYVRNQIRADQTGVDGATSAATQIVEKYRNGTPVWGELPLVEEN